MATSTRTRDERLTLVKKRMKSFRDRQKTNPIENVVDDSSLFDPSPPSRQLAASPILEEDSEDTIVEVPNTQIKKSDTNKSFFNESNTKVQSQSQSMNSMSPTINQGSFEPTIASRKARARMSAFSSSIGYSNDLLHQIPEQADESPDESNATTYTSDTRRTSITSTIGSTPQSPSSSFDMDRKAAFSSLEGKNNSISSLSNISEAEFIRQINQRQPGLSFGNGRATITFGHNRRRSSMSTRKMIQLPPLHQRRSTLDMGTNKNTNYDQAPATAITSGQMSNRLRSLTLTSDKDDEPKTAPLPSISRRDRPQSLAMASPIPQQCASPSLSDRPMSITHHGRSPSVPHVWSHSPTIGIGGQTTPRHFFVSPTTTYPSTTNFDFEDLQDDNERLSNELLRIRRDLSALAERSSKEYMALEATLHTERSRWEERERNMKERIDMLEHSRDLLVIQQQEESKAQASSEASNQLIEENDRLATQLITLKRHYEAQAQEWDSERKEWQKGIAEGRVKIISDSCMNEAEVQTDSSYIHEDTSVLSSSINTLSSIDEGMNYDMATSSDQEDVIAPLKNFANRGFSNRLYMKLKPGDECLSMSSSLPSPSLSSTSSSEFTSYIPSSSSSPIQTSEQVLQLRGQLASLRRETRVQIRSLEEENLRLRHETESQAELLRCVGHITSDKKESSKNDINMSPTHSTSLSLGDFGSLRKTASKHANKLSLAGLSGLIGHVIGPDPRQTGALEENRTRKQIHQQSPTSTFIKPTVMVTSPIEEVTEINSPENKIDEIIMQSDTTMQGQMINNDIQNSKKFNQFIIPEIREPLIFTPAYELDFTQSCKECLDSPIYYV